MGWAGHLARMEGGRSAFKILTGTPTGKMGEQYYNESWRIKCQYEELDWFRSR